MTPLQRLEVYLDRIDRFNPRLGAFLDTARERARKEAEASTFRHRRGGALSSLDGWCVGVKANIAVQGLPNHSGIDAYKADLASDDAAVVSRLRKAGAVILGTVNMHEGALGATNDNKAFGRAVNPWNTDLTPGGSSGGSAAAVAAGLCDVALGTDTMGSVRIPSAYCGVYGHKPSAGLVPTEGLTSLSPTLDHIGVHARSMSALRLASGIATETNSLPESLKTLGLKLGFWSGNGAVASQLSALSALGRCRVALEQAGCLVTDIEPSGYAYGRTRRAGLLVSEVEGYKVHRDRLATNPEGFSEAFRSLLEWGHAQSPDKVKNAYDHLAAVCAAADEVFSSVDFVIAPTAPQVAFAFEGAVPPNQADFTAWANIAGLPATAVFAGLSPEGLPLSLQVIGPRDADAQTLALAGLVSDVFGQAPQPPDFDGALPGN